MVTNYHNEHRFTTKPWVIIWQKKKWKKLTFVLYLVSPDWAYHFPYKLFSFYHAGVFNSLLWVIDTKNPGWNFSSSLYCAVSVINSKIYMQNTLRHFLFIVIIIQRRIQKMGWLMEQQNKWCPSRLYFGHHYSKKKQSSWYISHPNIVETYHKYIIL